MSAEVLVASIVTAGSVLVALIGFYKNRGRAEAAAAPGSSHELVSVVQVLSTQLAEAQETIRALRRRVRDDGEDAPDR